MSAIYTEGGMLIRSDKIESMEIIGGGNEFTIGLITETGRLIIFNNKYYTSREEAEPIIEQLANHLGWYIGLKKGELRQPRLAPQPAKIETINDLINGTL